MLVNRGSDHGVRAGQTITIFRETLNGQGPLVDVGRVRTVGSCQDGGPRGVRAAWKKGSSRARTPGTPPGPSPQPVASALGRFGGSAAR